MLYNYKKPDALKITCFLLFGKGNSLQLQIRGDFAYSLGSKVNRKKSTSRYNSEWCEELLLKLLHLCVFLS